MKIVKSTLEIKVQLLARTNCFCNGAPLNADSVGGSMKASFLVRAYPRMLRIHQQKHQTSLRHVDHLTTSCDDTFGYPSLASCLQASEQLEFAEGLKLYFERVDNCVIAIGSDNALIVSWRAVRTVEQWLESPIAARAGGGGHYVKLTVPFSHNTILYNYRIPSNPIKRWNLLSRRVWKLQSTKKRTQEHFPVPLPLSARHREDIRLCPARWYIYVTQEHFIIVPWYSAPVNVSYLLIAEESRSRRFI